MLVARSLSSRGRPPVPPAPASVVLIRSRAAAAAACPSTTSSDGRFCRAFSADEGDGDAEDISSGGGGDVAASSVLQKSNRELDREGSHTPPPCEAWNRDCPAWQSIDRDNTLVTPSHHDPDDYSRIIILEEAETDFKELSLGRMDDTTKGEIFRRHKEGGGEGGEWPVRRLATTHGISQPRAQAILLLKTWEESERATGGVTAEDDAREAAVHEAHLAAVRRLAEVHGVSWVLFHRHHQRKKRSREAGKQSDWEARASPSMNNQFLSWRTLSDPCL